MMRRFTLHIITIHLRLTGPNRRRVLRMPHRTRPVKYLRDLLKRVSLRLREEEVRYRKED